ncbi:MAG: SAM-dependent methyltransferase [Phycisphaerae bacterium]|nr:SAM-dependent methyltransferase [Phycisphaerae bacterium]
MSSQSIQLTENMQKWMRSHACRPSQSMKELCETTLQLEDGEMLTSPEQLQFLAFLARSIGAKNAIEIGVYTGASTLAIAEVLPEEGSIVSCDVSMDYISYCSPAWEQAGVEHKIDLRIAPALDSLQALLHEGKKNSFDFMYIDADKTNSKNYYSLGLQLLRPGGIIAIDNMFYGGQVADEANEDANTIATRELASFLLADDRVDYSLVPIGDGLALARLL